jgi:RimJ/RimL family protein N-acetyltransferase
MQILAGYDRAVGEWVAEQIPHIGSVDGLGPFVALGVQSDEGALLAGCVFHGYVPAYGTCELTFAAATPRWATRSVVRQLLAIPFEQYGCHRVTCVTPTTNARAARLLTGLGFVKEGAHVGAFGPRINAFSFRLLRRDYKRLFVRK